MEIFMKQIKKKEKIAFLSTFPPRECGIATFTEDLINAINELGIVKAQVIAINDSKKYLYDSDVVVSEIEKDVQIDYIKLIETLNNFDISLLVIQHEYGIFGGKQGKFILDLVNNINIPIITTLHTVLENPNECQKHILKSIGKKSSKIITMAKNTISILKSVYDIPPSKIEFIHHGVPRKPVELRETLKKKFNYGTDHIISTFGFVSPGKGIELGIEAISKVVKTQENVKYLILGQTHPTLKKDGLLYREKLEKLVKNLKLTDNVNFVNKYLTKEEIISYLQMSDIYMTPYINKQQAVSGTLAYASGYGKSIVSTGYLYANEMLANGRGIIAEFNNSNSIAEGIIYILQNPKVKYKMEKNMQKVGNSMYWDIVAKNYIEVFLNAIEPIYGIGVVQ
jgi:polysaccharide biosynthesis protein PslF